MFADVTDEELGRRLAARTLELIDVPSESRDEDVLHAHVLGVLRDGGVPVRDAGDTCLVAELPGPADGPHVVLAGHLDTVPAQDNRPGRLEDGAVWGLGAADMKGADAVMVEVALALAAQAAGSGRGPRGPVSVVLFGREELRFAESALTPLLEREPGLRAADLAVVMEPTANTIQAGCLGNINATWSFHGRAGHSARPWLADNAIERAADGIAALRAATPVVRHLIDGLEYAEVVQVTKIAGGIADNVIPDRVDCHVNYRYPPGVAAAEAEARLAQRCADAAPGSTLELLSNAPSGAVAVTHPLVGELVAAGLEVGAKQAWTPVAEFGVAGVAAVNLGPGDPAFAHRRDEQVAVDALVRCARLLEGLLCP